MRGEIAEMIAGICPLDDKERQDQAFVKEWIASGAEIFRREKPATPDVHLVSYFVPYDPIQNKVLLVHHKKALLWLPPGGHVDPGEHPKETARREMQEELFCEAEFLQESPVMLTVSKTVNISPEHTDVSLWYLVRGDAQAQYEFDPREFFAIEWVDIDHEHPQVGRFLQKLDNKELR
ncbi:MAG: NUDIX domain-containing protein [Simkaniaceae bacterium]|nr:NUDIX domain-containing protein [Simkaniaceae bacterium]